MSPAPVLALRALGLGDALAAVPALRALRRRFPGSPLLLAGYGPQAELLRDNGIVDGVVVTRGLDDDPPGRCLPGHVAVNLHGRGPQSHRLLLAGRPCELIAYACPAAGFLDGPEWDEAEHEVARWCRLVDPQGGSVDPSELLLPAPDPLGAARGADVVVVHPGASGPERRWPAARWAAVTRAVSGSGLDVVVTGGPGEEDLAGEVVAAAGLPASACLADALSLRELAALVASASLVLCGDTGVAHLATAYATPSVVLFGPVPPSRWGPPSRGGRHVVLWPGDDPARALQRIGVDDVLAAADAVLGSPVSVT